MSYVSLGDLARFFQFRADSTRVRGDLQRLAGELSSGRKADPAASRGGDFGPLGGIERSLTATQSFDVATGDLSVTVAAAQTALEGVQTALAPLFPALLLIDEKSQPTLVDTAAADAASRFATVVSALNTSVGGRAVFAGAATDGSALSDARAMIADLETAAAGATTAAGVAAAVDAWFAPGGGFEAAGYLGAGADMGAVQTGPGATLGLAVRADDPDLRAVLASLAMAALLDGPVLPGDAAERGRLAGLAGERMLTADNRLTGLRAGVGVLEARIEDARAANAAEAAALELARAGILSADPYRTATDLQAAEAQLDTLFTLTARLSRLSLSEYLR